MSPWTIACQAPLSMEFSRKEYWNGLPFPSPEDLPKSGKEPGSPALQADSLPSEPPGKPFEQKEDTLRVSFLHHMGKLQDPGFSSLPRAKSVSALILDFLTPRTVIKMSVFSSSPQPFWYQGPVSWKTIFPWTRGQGVGFSMIQVHYIYCAHFVSNLKLPLI